MQCLLIVKVEACNMQMDTIIKSPPFIFTVSCEHSGIGLFKKKLYILVK